MRDIVKPTSGPHVVRLPWDSEHFGFEVGRIIPQALDDAQLAKDLQQAEAMNLALVYWSAEDKCFPAAGLLDRFCGRLVDRKITYEAILDELLKSPAENHSGPIRVEEYPQGPSCAAL